MSQPADEEANPQGARLLGEAIERRVDEVKTLYAARTRQLLASLHRSQAEAEALRAANSSSQRAQYIAALQGHAHEREFVVDVLKSALAAATGRSPAEVDELVLKKTAGGPRRFRPKSREELGLEIAELEGRLGEAARALARLESALVAEAQRRDGDARRLRESTGVIEAQAAQLARLDAHARALSERVGEHERAAAAAAEQLEAFADIEDKARRVGERFREARDALAAQQREAAALRAERDRLAAELASGGGGGEGGAGGGADGEGAAGRGSSARFTVPALDTHGRPLASVGAGGAGGATPGAGLSLADPQEAELYVQRLRAHYGKEIAELRGALEALRDRMASSAEARDEDAARERADGARDTAEAVRLAELRARRTKRARDSEPPEVVRRKKLFRKKLGVFLDLRSVCSNFT